MITATGNSDMHTFYCTVILPCITLDIQGKMRGNWQTWLAGNKDIQTNLVETHQEPLTKRLALVHSIEIYFHYILYKSLWTQVECVECSAHWHATVDRKWYLWAVWKRNQSFHSPLLLGVVELLHSTQWISSWRPKRYNLQELWQLKAILYYDIMYALQSVLLNMWRDKWPHCFSWYMHAVCDGRTTNTTLPLM